MTEKDALLPCPFCKGAEEWPRDYGIRVIPQERHNGRWWTVQCCNCDARGPASDESEDEATKLWNTRAPALEALLYEIYEFIFNWDYVAGREGGNLAACANAMRDHFKAALGQAAEKREDEKEMTPLEAHKEAVRAWERVNRLYRIFTPIVVILVTLALSFAIFVFWELSK